MATAPMPAPDCAGAGQPDVSLRIDDALARARAAAGIDKFELVGMDACSDGPPGSDERAGGARQLTPCSRRRPSRRWAGPTPASSSTLQQNPGIDGGDLGATIVDTYIDEDAAHHRRRSPRLDLYGRGGGYGFGMSSVPLCARQAAQMGRNVTLAAVDLRRRPLLLDSVNQFAYALQARSRKASPRRAATRKSFTSVFGSDVPPSYIDLGTWSSWSNQVTSDGAGQPAWQCRARRAGCRSCMADKNGAEKPGATGVSVYFPNSQLYSSPVAGPPRTRRGGALCPGFAVG
jgi:hypothetical protein